MASRGRTRQLFFEDGIKNVCTKKMGKGGGGQKYQLDIIYERPPRKIKLWRKQKWRHWSIANFFYQYFDFDNKNHETYSLSRTPTCPDPVFSSWDFPERPSISGRSRVPGTFPDWPEASACPWSSRSGWLCSAEPSEMFCLFVFKWTVKLGWKTKFEITK